MQGNLQLNVGVPPELFVRMQRVQRSERFEKVPSLAGLARFLIEAGLEHVEKSPRTVAAAEGVDTTGPKGGQR